MACLDNWSIKRIREQIIDRNKQIFTVQYGDVCERNLNEYDFSSLGGLSLKRIFTTRAEAEKHLKELEGK